MAKAFPRPSRANLVHRFLRSGSPIERLTRSVLFVAAKAKRALNPRITYIGVTGSCGKTTTTQMIGAILATDGKCWIKADLNYIRAFAKSILSMPRSTKYSVNEVCAGGRGKMRAQLRVLRPQIGVITTIGTDHYRLYRSLEATAKEKGLLAEAVPQHGAAILNADDPHVRRMTGSCRGRVITYGLSSDADVRGADVSGAWPDTLSLTAIYGNQGIRIESKLVGEHWVTSILASIACGIVCGIDLKTCASALSNYKPYIARYSVHEISNGPAYVIDYKAVIWTIPAALAFIAKARACRKTIVFGTLSDYPGKAGRRYRRVAREALEVADRVIFVGPQSGHADKLRQGELHARLFAFQTAFEAAKFTHESSLPGELILLKGSPATDHLERIALSQSESVVCWKQSCGVRGVCPNCKNFRVSAPPPFGLLSGSGREHQADRSPISYAR
jgi:UDP-N-acetylmuramoyl-tripeptide--D-alanyl-D-alanine ligase